MDQINDLQKKINLVEGDLHAYQELTRDKMESNRSQILRLRKEDKDLHKALASRLEADATVIDKAFENADQRLQKKKQQQAESSPAKRQLKSMRIRSADTTERTALRNKSGEAANEIIDQALCDQKKRLNALKSETNKKKSILKDLQTTYDQLCKEASFAVEMSKGESRSAQKLTSLENRLDIAKRKSAEAAHINKVYQMIHQYLEEESLSFHNQLDELEQQIKRSKIELEDIRKMYEDAPSWPRPKSTSPCSAWNTPRSLTSYVTSPTVSTKKDAARSAARPLRKAPLEVNRMVAALLSATAACRREARSSTSRLDTAPADITVA